MIQRIQAQNNNSLKSTKASLFSRGFSLIELLVAMVIIGIVLTFVVLAFGDFGASKRLQMHQQHLADLIKLARIRAIIEAKTYGLHISKHSYSFFQFHHQINSPYGHWLKMTDSTFKTQAMPEHSKMQFNHTLTNSNPEILISADGHITPFTLSLATPSHEITTLKVSFEGDINLTQKLADDN